MEVTIQFAGGKELVQSFEHMAMAGGRQTTVRALRQAAEPIRAAAARLCRRGSEGPPHLADNIRIIFVEKRTRHDEPGVGIGAPREFYYDYWLEYGTRHSRAFPFYRPALDGQAAAALEATRQTYWVALLEGVKGKSVGPISPGAILRGLIENFEEGRDEPRGRR